MSIPSCSRRAACAFVLMSAVLWLACGLSGPTVLAADKAKAKAKPGGVPTRWNVKPDPPAAPLKWPDKLQLSIAQPPRAEDVLFPSTQSEFCVVGLGGYESDKAELWNLVTGEKVGAISGKPVQANKMALSPDGK